jgi:hypothetical protein
LRLARQRSANWRRETIPVKALKLDDHITPKDQAPIILKAGAQGNRVLISDGTGVEICSSER